jgi:type VI secretion system protein ImpB
MPESTQHKLDRIRPPRVQITYDVEIGDAIVMKELPFVVGIMADLSGDNKPTKPLKERKYTEIDRDNFNDIMYSIEPSLKLSVANKLKKKDADPASLVASLTFKNLDDFSPINVLKQVPQLSELFEARTRLSDLSAKLDGNDRLEEAINNALFVGDFQTEGDFQKKLEAKIKAASGQTGSAATDGQASSTQPAPVDETTPAGKAAAAVTAAANAAKEAAAATEAAKAANTAAAWDTAIAKATEAKTKAEAATEAAGQADKALQAAAKAAWDEVVKKSTDAQKKADEVAKAETPTAEQKTAAETAASEAIEALNKATAATKATKGVETATTGTATDAGTKADDKPLSAKQRRAALKTLLEGRKETDLKAANTYYGELKTLEDAVATAEKALKDFRDNAKRKARLEGRELPQDGGSDDE